MHKPVFLLTGHWGWWSPSDRLSSVLAFTGFLALAVAVAAVLHYLLEKPVERYLPRVRMTLRRPAEANAAAAAGPR